ncbi:MAG: tyrosine--tRNA ligase [Firmicutes bacterium]|nr:tyrosine--tRNA ligase [Bacillota bacterium]
MSIKNTFNNLKQRGFIKQVVFQDQLESLLNSKPTTFYVGFDPTADSLHIGHYIPIMAMIHLQRAGHRPIILIGGGTGLIGDPSGKIDMRAVLTKETAKSNTDSFKAQLSKFFSFEGSNAAIIVDNIDWLKDLGYIDFLREIGAHFSVNRMLSADCYKQRLEKGLTFIEFNYMLMQSYDFLQLYKKYDCVLQVGGDDQWSNILSGADLIRRKEKGEAFALTLPLLTNSDGAKMGKTIKGALWLDKNKLPPYEFYQYFRNVEDTKVEECLKLLTFLELDEIETLTKFKDERINAAKERLAYEVTKLIHGSDEADTAKALAKGAFGDGAIMPTITLNQSQDFSIVDLLVEIKIAATKSEARRLIEGGGIKIDDKKIESINHLIKDYCLPAQNEFIVHKGKKVHIKIKL